MTQQTFRRLHPHAWRFCLSIGLALTGGIAHAAAVDSDGDGLSDEQELSLGFDPHAVDSNMDGISDLDASRAMRTSARSTMSLQLNSASAGLADADADQIPDFLETYGYYALDLGLHGVKRIVPNASWNEFAARPAVLGYPVFQIAAKALKSNQLAQQDASIKSYVVEVAAAQEAIEAAFLDKGISQYSPLITGTTAQPGSIASIMAFLVTAHDYQVPTDGSGHALPVFFTNPLRVSTDNDPYTDHDEALGLFNGGRPSAPADHPLIAALPAIRARLVSYKLTDISQTANTLGETDTQTQVLRLTSERSQSHGFAQSFSLTSEVGTSGGSVKVEHGFTQSNQWSVGSSVGTEERNAHATFWQRTDTASGNCFAKLQLTVDLQNIGSALASNISTSLNVFLGDTLWRTVPLTRAGDSMTLSPRQRVTRTVLGQGTDESCLTLNETNYLEQGGLIGIETAMGDAAISVYDPSQNLIVQNGSWAVYKTLIENELARVDMDVVTTTGNRVTNSFWVVAAHRDYPNLNVSVEEILGRVYAPFSCGDKGLTAITCFATGAGNVALTRDAAVDFAFYDEAGEFLSRSESFERYQAMAGDDEQPLSKRPTPRTIVTIVQHAHDAPVFSHVEVLGELAPASGTGTGTVGYLVRALISDFYGIEQVDFCFDAAETLCEKMTSKVGTAEHSTSGQYEISLGQHTFTGNEHLRARNIYETTAQLKPTAFFLALGDELYDSLTEYEKKLQDKLDAIDQLAGLRSSNGDEYTRIIDSGLMIELDADATNAAIKRWRDALAQARRVCMYDVAAGGDAARLASDIQKCLAYLSTDLADAFNQDIQLYNPVKLPLSHVGGTETGWDNVHRGDVDSVNCQLQPGQFLVGVDLAKSNADGTPTAWLRYVTWDESSGTLRAAQETGRCGPNTGRDATFSTPGMSSAYQANLILDVGASIGGSKKSNKSNGQVTRLCVRYRAFNFKTMQFEGNSRINCDGKDDNSQNTEVHTGKLYVANSTELLFGLIIGGRSNSEFQYLRGIHLKNVSRQYDYKPWRTLVSGGKYHIRNSANKLLTVQGTAASSRGLTVAASNGSDAQVWIVEAVNDREFRLVPQSYVGFVTRASRTGTTTSVNRPASDDSTTVNFLQHWRLEQLVNGEYLIQSVLDDKKVLAADLNLKTFVERDTQQEWHFVRQDDPREVVTSAQSLSLTLPSTTLYNQTYYCAPILDSSDSKDNPRYFNRITLAATTASSGMSGGQILDDARQPLARWVIDRTATSQAPKPLVIDLPRYVSTKELRFCGYRYRTDGVLQGVQIEALCKSNATDLGPLQESCR